PRNDTFHGIGPLVRSALRQRAGGEHALLYAGFILLQSLTEDGPCSRRARAPPRTPSRRKAARCTHEPLTSSAAPTTSSVDSRTVSPRPTVVARSCGAERIASTNERTAPTSGGSASLVNSMASSA